MTITAKLTDDGRAALAAGTYAVAKVEFGEGQYTPDDMTSGLMTPFAPAWVVNTPAGETVGYEVHTEIVITDNRSGSVGEIAYKAADDTVLSVASRPAADGFIFEKTPTSSYFQEFIIDFDEAGPAPGTVYNVDLTFPTMTEIREGKGRAGTQSEVDGRLEGTGAATGDAVVVPLNKLPQEASATEIAERDGRKLVIAGRLPSLNSWNVPPSGVGGTANAIRFTVPAGAPVLDDGAGFRFRAESTSSGAVTVRVTRAGVNLGTVPLYFSNGQAGTGDIVSGRHYEIAYRSSNTRFEVVGVTLRNDVQNAPASAPAAASASQARAASSATVRLTPRSIRDFHDPQGLANAANISWNVASAPVAEVTITANRTLNVFTNGDDGMFYILSVTASGGARTLTLNANYVTGDAGDPTEIASGTTSMLLFRQMGSEEVFVSELKGY